MTFRVRSWAFSTCILGVLGSPMPAAAQEARPASESDKVRLEEITVTATRREESLGDVPISVSAFGDATLESQTVREVVDIGRLTPGLTVRPAYAGGTSIAIRGITSAAGAATTGVYIDDTPIQTRRIGDAGAATNVYPTIFDLERVEVLRGPQGTLFGAGSEGGTVRFITPQPDLESYSGYARGNVGYTQGGDPSYEAGIAAGGPIGKGSVGFRASAFYQHAGGWIDRVDPVTYESVEDNANSKNTFVGRLAFAFVPTDSLRITPAVYYMDSHTPDEARYWVNISDPDNHVFKNGNPTPSPYDETFTLASLAIEWNLSKATFFSNTSYFNRENYNDYDLTVSANEILLNIVIGTPIPLLPGAEHIGFRAGYFNGQNVFTQEFRLSSSDANAKLTWTAGLFYQDARQKFTDANRGPLDDWLSVLVGAPVTTEQIFGIPLIQPGDVILNNDSRSEDEQAALFGDLRYRFGDSLELTAGLRYSENKFDFTNASDGAFNGGPTFSSGSHRESSVTPKLGLTYRPSDGQLFYATAAKGFRPGGANASVPDLCDTDLVALGLSGTPAAYDSDSVWSYELGAKNGLANGRLRTNASVFYIKWKDIQQSILLPFCTYNFIANLGEAVSKGFDLQFEVDVAGGFLLGASVGYNDAKYTKDVTAGGSSVPGAPIYVSDGDLLPVPKWTFTVSPEFRTVLASGRDFYLRGDYTYLGGYPTFNAAPAVDYRPDGRAQGPTRLLNLRGGVRWDAWDIAIFVNNALDSTDVINYSNVVIGSPLFRASTFRSRTIGAEARFAF